MCRPIALLCPDLGFMLYQKTVSVGLIPPLSDNRSQQSQITTWRVCGPKEMLHILLGKEADHYLQFKHRGIVHHQFFHRFSLQKYLI